MGQWVSLLDLKEKVESGNEVPNGKINGLLGVIVGNYHSHLLMRRELTGSLVSRQTNRTKKHNFSLRTTTGHVLGLMSGLGTSEQSLRKYAIWKLRFKETVGENGDNTFTLRYDVVHDQNILQAGGSGCGGGCGG